MSLQVSVGKKGNFLERDPYAAKLLHLDSPVLFENNLLEIQNSDFKVTKLKTSFDIEEGSISLKNALLEIQ